MRMQHERNARSGQGGCRRAGRGLAGSLLLAAVLAAPALLCPSTALAAGVVKGQLADFELPSLQGERYRLSELVGKKVIVISFWNQACKPCRKEMPELQKLYEELKDKGLEILSINTDGPSELPGVKPYVMRSGYTFPVLLDSEARVVKLYNPRQILPYTLLINLEGRVVFTHVGYNSGDVDELKGKILPLLPSSGAATPAGEGPGGEAKPGEAGEGVGHEGE